MPEWQPNRTAYTTRDVPVLNGIATLPSGATVATQADRLRFPLCGAISDWTPSPSPALSCELEEAGHTGVHKANLGTITVEIER